MKLATYFGARAHIRTGLAAGCLAAVVWGVGLGLVFLASLPARADDAALAGNPYAAIPDRNIFNLVPIPTNAPVEVKKPDPPAKITPDGIMTIFGLKQALFKVAWPPKAGQPPQEQSYTMGEGDREDGIAVTKIDEVARAITFDNNGVTQTIPLVLATGASGGAGGGGGGGPAAGPGGFHGRSGGFNPGYANRFSANGGNAGGSAYGGQPASGASPANVGGTPSASALSYEGAQAKLNSILNDPNHLTPEAQVIMMEQQRLQLQSQNDPSAAMIPPTELTPDQGDNSAPGP